MYENRWTEDDEYDEDETRSRKRGRERLVPSHSRTRTTRTRTRARQGERKSNCVWSMEYSSYLRHLDERGVLRGTQGEKHNQGGGRELLTSHACHTRTKGDLRVEELCSACYQKAGAVLGDFASGTIAEMERKGKLEAEPTRREGELCLTAMSVTLERHLM
jgi:hypothetical protein